MKTFNTIMFEELAKDFSKRMIALSDEFAKDKGIIDRNHLVGVTMRGAEIFLRASLIANRKEIGDILVKAYPEHIQSLFKDICR